MALFQIHVSVQKSLFLPPPFLPPPPTHVCFTASSDRAVSTATAAASLPLVSSIQGGLQRDVPTAVGSRTLGFRGNNMRLVVTSPLEKTQTQTKKLLDSSNSK